MLTYIEYNELPLLAEYNKQYRDAEAAIEAFVAAVRLVKQTNSELIDWSVATQRFPNVEDKASKAYQDAVAKYHDRRENLAVALVRKQAAETTLFNRLVVLYHRGLRNLAAQMPYPSHEAEINAKFDPFASTSKPYYYGLALPHGVMDFAELQTEPQKVSLQPFEANIVEVNFLLGLELYKRGILTMEKLRMEALVPHMSLSAYTGNRCIEGLTWYRTGPKLREVEAGAADKLPGVDGVAAAGK